MTANDMQVLLLLLVLYGPGKGPFPGVDIDRAHSKAAA
jgi:hypothetical protein